MALNTETARRLISTQCGFTEAQQRFLGKVLDDLYDTKTLGAVATAATTVNNSATLVDVAGLSVELSEPGSYTFEANIIGFSGSTPNFDFKMSLPSGAAGYMALAGSATTAPVDSTGELRVAGISDDQGINLYGTIAIAAGEEGTFQLQFAQGTANASNTQVYAGSTLTVTKVSDTAWG